MYICMYVCIYLSKYISAYVSSSICLSVRQDLSICPSKGLDINIMCGHMRFGEQSAILWGGGGISVCLFVSIDFIFKGLISSSVRGKDSTPPPVPRTATPVHVTTISDNLPRLKAYSGGGGRRGDFCAIIM